MQRACVRLKMSLLSTMWPRLSFRFTELMLWILLAYVPLNDVGIVSPAAVWSASQTHWGLGPQGPLEANALQGPVEPLAGGPGDYDVPQLFSPLQRELPWTYPEPPVEPESEVREEFQPWRAAMVPQLGLRCGEKKVSIEVNQDLWGNGDLIQPAELTLGGCPHVEHDDRAGVLAYEYELQDCGSQKLTKDGFIIYVFVLQYRPKMSARLPITRTQNTDITVTCSYPQNVVSQQAIRLPAEEN